VTGLRDRKKREIRHRIIQAAASLFADNGIDATTMEEIASASDVSVATVYNYFGTKSALLLAGVEEDTERMVEAGILVIESPGDDAVAATKRLMRCYLEHFVNWDKRLLREVLGAAYQGNSGPDDISEELAQMDQRLIEQTAVLLSHFHTRGQLAEGADPYEATLAVVSVFVLQMFMFMFDFVEISDLPQQIDRQIELVFTGVGRHK
jgi:AcrR family transcriptional regulator